MGAGWGRVEVRGQPARDGKGGGGGGNSSSNSNGSTTNGIAWKQWQWQRLLSSSSGGGGGGDNGSGGNGSGGNGSGNDSSSRFAFGLFSVICVCNAFAPVHAELAIALETILLHQPLPADFSHCADVSIGVA
jgi:hypothetical protein